MYFCLPFIFCLFSMMTLSMKCSILLCSQIYVFYSFCTVVHVERTSSIIKQFFSYTSMVLIFTFNSLTDVEFLFVKNLSGYIKIVDLWGTMGCFDAILTFS